jgi:hypothetical protein
MVQSKLLLAITLASLSPLHAELLRGILDDHSVPKKRTAINRHMNIPNKDLQKLKRLNIERKHLNQRKKQERESQSVSDV